MDWRSELTTLQGQFEAQATKSSGLHHLFVEVADDKRERARGPDWFVAKNPQLFGNGGTVHTRDPWDAVESSTFLANHPSFREILPGEPTDHLDESRVVRDRGGRPRAFFTPQSLRAGYLCGDHSAVEQFKTLAAAASNALTDVSELSNHRFADDLVDIFRTPVGLERYIFGDVASVPTVCLARGWDTGIYQENSGVVIDVPVGGLPPDEENWLLLLHRLCWHRISGFPLQGGRQAWDGNTSIPYEWVAQRDTTVRLPEEWLSRFAQIPTSSYYSAIGSRERPLDVNLASSFAIQLLLAKPAKPKRTKPTAPDAPDYSKEPWNQKPLPTVVSADVSELTPQNVDVLVLTATRVERDTVLKYLRPLADREQIVKVFQDQNTYFVGQLGNYETSVCMCEMGSVGRDASSAVTADAIRFWSPIAVLMVGIAFGRDQNKQRIGDVLVADRIIPYEPKRQGAATTFPRGHQHSVGATLLNRFRNTTGWSFGGPDGVPCDVHFGPILSGEKLVDDPDFKEDLFEDFPHAIGGEMEGAGLSASAERLKCEWILVKGICDWADGDKEKKHQAFAAAAATDLVTAVLSEPGVLDGLKS